jgi:DNA-binding NarL/FixJ family response regulator
MVIEKQEKNLVQDALAPLTQMEKKVVSLISHGLSTLEIVDRLCLSKSTVKTHRHNICRKLELPKNQNALLNWVLLNNHLIKEFTSNMLDTDV